jgi:hypothetical protein
MGNGGLRKAAWPSWNVRSAAKAVKIEFVQRCLQRRRGDTTGVHYAGPIEIPAKDGDIGYRYKRAALSVSSQDVAAMVAPQKRNKSLFAQHLKGDGEIDRRATMTKTAATGTGTTQIVANACGARAQPGVLSKTTERNTSAS